jgi:hypothetical protein
VNITLWGSELFSLSGVVNTRKETAFQRLDLFLSSGEGRETPTLLGPLEGTTLNQWTERHPVSEMLCFLLFPIPDDGPNPVP